MQHQPALVLRLDKLRELCAANDIENLRVLATRINVAPSTFWRIENGIQRPSSTVIARVKMAFPLVPFDELIEVAA